MNLNLVNKIRDLINRSEKPSLVKWSLVAIVVILVFGMSSMVLLQSTPQGEESSFFPLVDQAGLVMKFVLQFLFVILLIYVSLNLFRRWQTGEVVNQKNMKVVETLHLTPQRALYIVKIAKKTMVIGATDQNINLLTSYDDHSIDNNDFQSMYSSHEWSGGGESKFSDRDYKETIERR